MFQAAQSLQKMDEAEETELMGLLNYDFMEEKKDEDLVDTATKNIISFHMNEKVQQNLEFRVPPEQDKKSLKYKYKTLSMKRMNELLDSAKDFEEEKKQEEGTGKKKLSQREIERQHKQQLEIEIKTMEQDLMMGKNKVMEEPESKGNAKTPQHESRKLSIETIDLNDNGFGEFLHKEGLDHTAYEFDDYFNLFETVDNNRSSYQTQSKGRSTRTGVQRTSMNRPQRPSTAGALSSSSSHRGIMSSTSPVDMGHSRSVQRDNQGIHNHNNHNTDDLSRSYQERHGFTTAASVMAPSPVHNTSVDHLRNRRIQRNVESQKLYKTVLQEARRMQARFLACVEEANQFADQLGTGNSYRVIARDPHEDQQWGAILSNNEFDAVTNLTDHSLEAGSIADQGQPINIPKGTGQRIGNLMVEVTHPSRADRCLGTDHFFREHGRLQHAIQKKTAVKSHGSTGLTGSSKSYGAHGTGTSRSTSTSASEDGLSNKNRGGAIGAGAGARPNTAPAQDAGAGAGSGGGVGGSTLARLQSLNKLTLKKMPGT